MKTVEIIYGLAKRHKAVKGFRYNRKGGKGSGSDAYPLIWVDDPIYGGKASDSAMRETVNFDVLFLVSSEKEHRPAQSKALTIALSLVEEINKHFHTYKTRVESWEYLTLSKYTDDDSAGVRFTARFTSAIPINLCEQFFDDDKELEDFDPFPSISTEGAEGCEIFNEKDGLPDF